MPFLVPSYVFWPFNLTNAHVKNEKMYMVPKGMILLIFLLANGSKVEKKKEVFAICYTI